MVIGHRLFFCFDQLGVVYLFDLLLIVDMDLSLMPFVVPGADHGIQCNAKGNQKCQGGNTDCDYLLFRRDSSFLKMTRGGKLPGKMGLLLSNILALLRLGGFCLRL